MSAATFSLKTLLVLVTVSAVGCYALVQHTPLWASIVVTLAYALLSVGAILAVVRRGSPRAFWAGFAAGGSVYLALAFSPLVFTGAPSLLTTKALIAGWKHVGKPAPPADDQNSDRFTSPLSDQDLSDLEGQYNDIMMGFNRSFYEPEQQEYLTAARSYLRIGQSLWSLALGFTIGLLAAFFHWRERRKDGKET